MKFPLCHSLTLIRRAALTGVLAVCAFAFAAIVTPANAKDDSWMVIESSGKVLSAQGETEWRSVENGDILPPGMKLETGPEGRVQLVRNGDTITVSPDSHMEIGVAANDRDTNVGVTLGTLLLKVETRPTYTFNVNTPYLAALVKGTTFTVTVSGQGAAVHVVEGAVQVSSQATQQVALLRPGQTATIAMPSLEKR